jgi:hypothetical protein
MRAVFESSNTHIKNTHEPTLNTISNWVINRKIFPYPLNCYCFGIRDLKNIQFIGFETEVTDEKVKEITALSMPLDEELELCFAKFLKTTREKQFQDKKEKSGLKNKSGKELKRFSVKDKTEVEKKMHKTTLFDCLYRLRIKSNYEEAETYILSEMSEEDANGLYESLKSILNISLFSFEYIIINYIGKEEFMKIYEEFSKKIKKDELKKDSIFSRIGYLS